VPAAELLPAYMAGGQFGNANHLGINTSSASWASCFGGPPSGCTQAPDFCTTTAGSQSSPDDQFYVWRGAPRPPVHPPVQGCGPQKPHEGGLLAVTALRRPLPAPWTPFDTVRCGLCSSLSSGFARLHAEEPCHDSMATCPDGPWLAPHVHDHLGQATCTFTAAVQHSHVVMHGL